MSDPRKSPPAELLACVTAFDRSIPDTFDPQGFLAEFTVRVQRLVLHDRVLVDYLEDDRRTFTVFAEDPAQDRLCTQATTRPTSIPLGGTPSTTRSSRPSSQVTSSSSRMRSVIPAFVASRARQAELAAAGARAGVAAPIYARGRVIGFFGVSSSMPGICGEEHLTTGRQIADLIGTFVQSIVLFLRECRRPTRLKAVAGLVPILGASLKGR